MKYILFLFFMCLGLCIRAQKDTSQHRFAQTYFGVSSHFIFGGSSEYLDSAGNIQRVDLPTVWQPKLSIGGLHFWKRVDFYISFSLPNVKWDIRNGMEYKYSAGIETGIRYYPFFIKNGTISPYIGLNWANLNYTQKAVGMSIGTEINRSVLNLETGVAYRNKGFIVECNFQCMATHQFRYPLSRTTHGTLDFSPISAGISFKYVLDFTAGSASPNSRKLNARLDSLLVQKKWDNAFHIGIGPSAAFGLGKSGYVSKLRPFLDDPSPAALCPDFSIGYYIAKPALDVNLSFRPMWFGQSGYDFQHELTRISTALEIYHFLFNYKGFVPFAGAFASYEYVHLVEKDQGAVVTDKTAHLPGWGFTVGWDIRPNRNDWWVLRTNLRFTPYVPFTVNNQKYVMSQWEFNFIQFVFYPQRLVATKQIKKLN
jgi:hypothetical protein